MSAPDPFDLGGVDPLIALGAEQMRLVAQMNAPGQPQDVTQAEFDALSAIEHQMVALVPISAAGAAALVRYLQWRMRGYDWGEIDDQIANNLLVWLACAQAP